MVGWKLDSSASPSWPKPRPWRWWSTSCGRSRWPPGPSAEARRRSSWPSRRTTSWPSRQAIQVGWPSRTVRPHPASTPSTHPVCCAPSTSVDGPSCRRPRRGRSAPSRSRRRRWSCAPASWWRARPLGSCVNRDVTPSRSWSPARRDAPRKTWRALSTSREGPTGAQGTRPLSCAVPPVSRAAAELTEGVRLGSHPDDVALCLELDRFPFAMVAAVEEASMVLRPRAVPAPAPVPVPGDETSP